MGCRCASDVRPTVSRGGRRTEEADRLRQSSAAARRDFRSRPLTEVIYTYVSVSFSLSPAWRSVEIPPRQRLRQFCNIVLMCVRRCASLTVEACHVPYRDGTDSVGATTAGIYMCVVMLRDFSGVWACRSADLRARSELMRISASFHRGA